MGIDAVDLSKTNVSDLESTKRKDRRQYRKDLYDNFKENAIFTVDGKTVKYADLKGSDKRKAREYLKHQARAERDRRYTQLRRDEIAATGHLDGHKKTEKILIEAGFGKVNEHGQPVRDAKGKQILDFTKLNMIFDASAGELPDGAASDNYLNYQNEQHAFAHRLSVAAKDGSESFTRYRAHQVAEGMGTKPENAVNIGRTALAAAGGAGIGYTVGTQFKVIVDAALNVSNSLIAGGTASNQVTGMSDSWKKDRAEAFAAVGITSAVLLDLVDQVTRDEEAVTHKINVHTALDACKTRDFKEVQKSINLLRGASDLDKTILTSLAALYMEADGKINTVSMLRDCRDAAGGRDILNRREAVALLGYKAKELDVPPENTNDTKVPENEKPEIEEKKEEKNVELEEKQEQNNEQVQQEEPCEHTVIVQNGESLSKLAKKYGVSIQAIKELNKDQLKTFYNSKNCDDNKAVQGFLVGAKIKLPCEANIEAAKNNKDEKGAKADYKKAIIRDRNDLCDERIGQATVYTIEELDKMAN